ncbi:MAG: hypothetical protein FJ104_01510 [Deltaproteobacteria bacterium]|nr:hypothetical protein [Deltaproteobacteria bacterium]
MNPQALIDGIVQQTTVLIAQISTAAGIRAPLARVADQVFLSLSREIEAQGVGGKVVADMFGLAIRTYQKKVQRLLASQSEEGRTLWEVVLDVVRKEGPVTRARLLERFASDPERELTAVISDLVASGLVYSSGRGDAVVYGVTSEADRRALDDPGPEALALRLWAEVFEHPGILRTDLAAAQRDADTADRLIGQLVADGQVREEVGARLYSSRMVIPIGDERGWEVALLQHFRAVTQALGSKVRSGATRSHAADRIGGATYAFGVRPGHPLEAEVYGLLARVRSDVQGLWDRVSAVNEAEPEHEGKRERVVFYFGQTVIDRETDDQTSNGNSQ